MCVPRLPLVSIIDYGMGNLFSVKQACEYVGLEAVITSKAANIFGADAVILPGVGAFANAMEALNKLDLISPITDLIKSGKPFMGICLGFQLLMSESEEFGRHSGLNIFPGQVIKFPVKNEHARRIKIPQVGWNRINKPLFTNGNFWKNSALSGIHDGEFMYFVHSYYCKPENNGITLSLTNYDGIEYCSSIQWKNVCAFQFHPEKSASEGLKLYKNWSLFIKKYKGGYGRDIGN